MEPPKEPSAGVKSVEEKGVEENRPGATEAPVQLTEKQKKKLATKEKYKNRPKSKLAGQVRFFT